jgi:hypothetical protein
VCGECSIAAVSSAGGVGAHDPEMISGARTQARNARDDVLIIIASLSLVGRSGSVADGSSKSVSDGSTRGLEVDERRFCAALIFL